MSVPDGLAYASPHSRGSRWEGWTLEHVVKINETHIGGKRKDMSNAKRKALRETGRGAVGKTPVIGVQERGRKVAAKPVNSADSEILIGFVESHTEPGSTVYTDDAAAYGALVTIFNHYRHETVNHNRSDYVSGDVHTNSIESVCAVLKRSITGTWHHVSKKHHDRYVNEATFRPNESNCEVDTLDRMAALVSGVGGKRLRYKDLIA